jgi:hypothetical protein
MNTTKFLKSDNCKILLFSIIIAIGFFFILMPMIENCYTKDNNNIKEKLENINSEVPTKIDTNKCSKSCCLTTQWPLPKELLSNDIQPEELKNYIPTNMFCNLGNGSGCACVTKSDFNYLTSRGGNAPHANDD